MAKYQVTIDEATKKVEAPSPLRAAELTQTERKLPRGSIICVRDKRGRERRYHVLPSGRTSPQGRAEA